MNVLDALEPTKSKNVLDALDTPTISNMSETATPTTSQTGVPIPEPFYSKPLTPRQFQSFRAANSEIQRSGAQLRAIGKGDEVDQTAQEHPGIMGALETATTPIFDMLNIFPHTTASAAIEYHRSGNAYRAFKQGAADFLNTLPGIDGSTFADYLPTPLHATWSDYMKESDPYWKEHEWQAAGAGLLLDILTDPLTYTGVGLAEKLATKAKLPGLASVLRKATPMEAIKGVANLPLVSDALGAIERTTPYQGFGKRFIKDFEFKQLAKQKPELAESIKNALSAQKQMGTDISLGRVDVKDAIDALYGDMSAGEKRLFGATLDQPDEMKSLIKQVATGDPEKEASMLQKMDAIIAHRNAVGRADVESGLLSPEAFVGRTGRYAPGMTPMTEAGRKASDDLLARLGVEPETLPNEIVPGLKVGYSPQIGQGTTAFSKAKTYDTLEERLIAGMPTELDASIQDARRGFESVRYAASRRFVDSVLSDTKLAMPIKDANYAKELADAYELGDAGLKKFIEDYGPDIGPQKFSDAKLILSQMQDKGYGVYRPFRAGEPTYVIPKPFIDQLNYANRVMSNTDDLASVLRNAKDIQDVWKAWALVSPGFHMRNMFSNIWNNMLGGVTPGKVYGEALILQGANPEKNPLLAKLAAPGKLFKNVDEIEAGGLVGNQITEAARKLGTLETGVNTDIAVNLERQMFSRMDKTNDALKMAEKIAPEGKGEFIRNVLETAPTPPSLMARQLGTDLEGNFSIHGFSQAQQNNPLLRFNREVGNAIENNAKLAHFISKLREGLSPEDAAMSAKKYLFDYGDLTDFEKNVMKFVLPFYTWQRKNIPLQIQSILENPGRYAALTGKPINAIQSLSDDWKNIPTPDYFAEQNAVRLPRLVSKAMETLNSPLSAMTNVVSGAVGSTNQIQREGIQPEFINPNLPFQDLNRMNYKDVVSSLTPTIKMFIENVPDRGYSTFTDRPIERYPGEPGILPIGNKKGEAAVASLIPPVGKAIRLIDKAKRGQLAEQLSTELLGIKLMGVDVDTVNRGKVYQRQEKIRALKQKYMDLGTFTQATQLPLVGQ